MYKCKRLQEFQLQRALLPFLQIFIITKYLKQEVDDDLNVCMDERSSCGLSITGDIKICQCHVIKGNDVTTPNGKVSYRLLSRSCFCCLNLITAAPL